MKRTLWYRFNCWLWNKLWIKWHTTICRHSYWVMKPDGMRFRCKARGNWVYRMQIPICQWLDAKAHSYDY